MRTEEAETNRETQVAERWDIRWRMAGSFAIDGVIHGWPPSRIDQGFQLPFRFISCCGCCCRAMDVADKAALASKRVWNIIETMTFNVYRYISR